ncbi:homeobox protein onecut [Trichonephila inaurata madagascariensis]|uniref:Homeobox protein onecut n=1 Tax=Trichonephila inaurata madagascariensis TaxID=2747483 RepID=A0A8X6X6T5_9ARAC|nr:homeobox protein onecut [Trichonephila inaurata madagascariensis]
MSRHLVASPIRVKLSQSCGRQISSALTLGAMKSKKAEGKPRRKSGKKCTAAGAQLIGACKRKEEQQQQQQKNPNTPKKPRLVFTDLQRRTLQAIFKETKRPSKEMQITISQQLGLELSTVGNFFMNARRRSQDKWQDTEDKAKSDFYRCETSQAFQRKNDSKELNYNCFVLDNKKKKIIEFLVEMDQNNSGGKGPASSS